MNKKLECPRKIKFSRKRLYPSNSVIYLGVKIDENLDWKDQTYDIVTKLNRANALLYKIINCVSFNTLKVIYFANFAIIHNQPRNSHSGSLFNKSNILKFEDKILISNIIFISKSINNLLPSIFKNWFIFSSEIHNYGTVSSSTDKLFNPSFRTDFCGKNSIIASAINCLNKTQNILRVSHLNLFIQPKLKKHLHKDASANTNNLFKILVENYIRINTSLI